MTTFEEMQRRGVDQDKLRDWAERFVERDQTMGVLERVSHMAPGAVDDFLEKRSLVRELPDRETAVQRLVDLTNEKWDAWYGPGSHVRVAAPTEPIEEEA